MRLCLLIVKKMELIQKSSSPSSSKIFCIFSESFKQLGRGIVEFLENSLIENVAEEINVDEDVDMEIRLQRAFLITDIQSYDNGIMTSGATVAICLFKRELKSNKFIIHAANAGDARAVVSCTHKTDNKKAYRLTHDHRADDPAEIKRIQEAGGFVLKNRVLGILAVARSLGDNNMKEFVICKPFVQSIEIEIDPDYDTRKNEIFIIVACDGLWDVMDDQEAVDMVRKLSVSMGLKKDSLLKKKRLVAQMLIEEALDRKSVV